MSSFVANPEYLDGMATTMERLQHQIEHLHLPARDFAGWSGDPRIGALLEVLCRSMHDEMTTYHTQSQNLITSLRSGADHYRSTENAVGRAAGGGGGR